MQCLLQTRQSKSLDKQTFFSPKKTSQLRERILEFDHNTSPKTLFTFVVTILSEF